MLCLRSCECFLFCKQKTADEMRISDWSSDVCSSDLAMKLFPGATRFQRWTMGATFLIVATYAISQNKQSLVEVSKTRLSSPSPGIIDGDTIDFPNGRVRVVGIDARDDDLPQLKAISSEALRGLALRDGGMDCSVSMFDHALRRGTPCRHAPKRSGRLTLAWGIPA